MNFNRLFLKLLSLFFLFTSSAYSQIDTAIVVSDSINKIQSDSIDVLNDSINNVFLEAYRQRVNEIDNLQRNDSIARMRLEEEIGSLTTTENTKKEDLQKQLDELQAKEANRIAQKKAQIESLRSLAVGYPALGPAGDTLFFMYSNQGSLTARERAQIVSDKIKTVYNDDKFIADSIKVTESELLNIIEYKDIMIMAISESDAMWHEKDRNEMSEEYAKIIKTSIQKAIEKNSISRILIRIGLVILVLAGSYLLIWQINRLYYRFIKIAKKKRNKYLKDLSYKNYTFVSTDQELKIILFLLKVLRWIMVFLAVYLILPLLFSIFPVTRGWADYLFGLVWSPFRRLILSFWRYLPNIFTILVIYFVMKYIIRFVKYIFSEIEAGKLKISGFHPDWALPTFQIVRVILVAFEFVMIFPYLPFSNSPIFTGVSVFLGLLVSLGSSSAISNVVAGLVITYMRPFKVGDRIKIGETTGEVLEKTILVTRLRTVKNEEITIPNSAVLSGNTVNYSTFSKKEGLIIHTKVTMGYEYSWEEIHEALIESALRTEGISKKPKPFVLQVSLDDFYISYQLNAYIKDANKQAKIYSDLHQHIIDVFNEKGFELLSPHYQANRDGNPATFPEKYLPKDYKNPGFKVNIESDER